MASSIGTILLAAAISMTGGHKQRGFLKNVLPPGPGYGWGYANGNPDGYGYHDLGYNIPLGGDRGPLYHFPRYYALPMDQMVFPTYFNVYATRGQKFLPYTGDGGDHPMGGYVGATSMPLHPYQDTLNSKPLRPVPTFDGRVEAPWVYPGQTGLRP